MNAHTWDVPVNARKKGNTLREGKITYRANTPTPPKGVIAFSYYYRFRPTTANHNIQVATGSLDKIKMYLNGIKAYVEMTKYEPFCGWKVIIYTDTKTIQDLMIELPNSELKLVHTYAQEILSDPSVIVAECSWPEYFLEEGKIDGTILRIFRFRAMVDFPDIPVFVRDADTYFEDILKKSLDINKLNPSDIFIQKLSYWEDLLFKNQIKIQKPFLIAGLPTYQRKWHVDSLQKFKSVGLLAGMVNSLGNIPEWTSGQLWNESLDFIRARCRIVETRNPDAPLEKQVSKQISNVSQEVYIGKDEQIIIFIWMPVLIERTFFFYFDFSQERGEDGNFIIEWRAKGKEEKYYEDIAKQFNYDDKFASPYSILRRITGLEDPALLQKGSFILAPYWSPEKKLKRKQEFEEEYKEKQKNQIYINKERIEQLVPDLIVQYNLKDDTISDCIDPAKPNISRLNLFCVVHAFEYPNYHLIMYKLFKALNKHYEEVCQRKSPKGGGPTKTRRKHGRLVKASITL